MRGVERRTCSLEHCAYCAGLEPKGAGEDQLVQIWPATDVEIATEGPSLPRRHALLAQTEGRLDELSPKRRPSQRSQAVLKTTQALAGESGKVEREEII